MGGTRPVNGMDRAWAWALVANLRPKIGQASWGLSNFSPDLNELFTNPVLYGLGLGQGLAKPVCSLY